MVSLAAPNGGGQLVPSMTTGPNSAENVDQRDPEAMSFIIKNRTAVVAFSSMLAEV